MQNLLAFIAVQMLVIPQRSSRSSWPALGLLQQKEGLEVVGNSKQLIERADCISIGTNCWKLLRRRPFSDI